MDVDQVTDRFWLRFAEEKYLVWEVRIALLLAAVVSYFTMPFVITFLVAVVWVTVMVTLRNNELTSAEDKNVGNG